MSELLKVDLPNFDRDIEELLSEMPPEERFLEIPITKETYERIGQVNAEDEGRECQFVREGIFDHLGGLADPRLIFTSRRRKLGVLTPEEWQSDDLVQTNLQGDNVHQDGRPPALSYNPAYSDWVHLTPPKYPSPISPEKVSSDLPVPLVWTVPFRGRRGTYCGYLHVEAGSNQGAYKQEICPTGGLDHHLVTGALHCSRPGCPFCGWFWATRKAREAEELMEAWQSVQLNDERHWMHIVVSPSQEYARKLMTTKQGLDRLYDEAISMISSHGVAAGLIACHPWRRLKSDEMEDGTKAPSFSWRAGPHFHVIGWGYLNWIELANNYKATGWIINEIKPEEERLSLSGTISYILSHVGLPTAVYKDKRPSRQLNAFRYFGDFANGSKHNENGMRRLDVIKMDSIKKCKTCGCPLEYLQDDQKFVTYMDRTQIFCRPRDYADLKHHVSEMEQEMVAADIPIDIIEYNKLEFYLSCDKIIMASKLKRIQDEIREQRKKTRNECKDLIHKVRWIK